MSTGEDVEFVEEETEVEERRSFLEAARKVLLASVGALALAQDELEDFVNRLVERGEIAEKDGRALIRDLMERRKQRADDVKVDVKDGVDRRVAELLHRMNVPTKQDIDMIDRKIAALSEKVDELTEARGINSGD